MNEHLINTIRGAVDSEVRKEAEDRGQLNLGMLKNKLSDFNSGLLVEFDKGGSPCEPHSYRGYYDQLALERSDSKRTVSEVLEILEEATGKTYTGYKGGDFRMTDYTMVWGSSYGTSSGIAIVDVVKENDKVVIKTKDTYNE